MNTASAYITIRGIHIDVIYKDIKNLHIGVYPPLGRVRVAAPLRLDDDRVRLAVIQRMPWIKKQREQLSNAERQTKREMVTGESHYVWGVRHRLKVIERPGRTHVEVDGQRLLLYVPIDTNNAAAGSSAAVAARATSRPYPQAHCRLGAHHRASCSQWTIRRMKTKWGSCNRETGHIWFNLELAKKHPDCLEYIVVHEMVHLLERGHGEHFTKLIDRFLPDWRARRDQLNGAPLADEEWGHDDCQETEAMRR